MGSTLFRDPQARSSALAALGTPQPRAFGSLNRVDPLDSASNLYVEQYYYGLPEPTLGVQLENNEYSNEQVKVYGYELTV